jgi:hypothetical protein
MTATINNEIPFVPEGTIDPAAGLNDALNHIDAILQVAIIAIQDAPPGSPAEGDRYIVGTGSGAWAGHDDEVARYLDGAWTFHDTVAFVFNLDDSNIWVNTFSSAGWISLATSSSSSYRQVFGPGDLDSSGILTVTHGLGEQYPVTQIYDDNDLEINVQADASGGINSCSFDLSAYDVASGWRVVIIK